MSSLAALVKRREQEMALMPPPPTKRTKRPAAVLDEDDYTDALSEIIARDYFPGLAEAKAQEEYLTALTSSNDAWIKEAGRHLRDVMTPGPKNSTKRTSRDARFDSPRPGDSRTPVPDTPRANASAFDATPVAANIRGTDGAEATSSKPRLDTSDLSLTSFQAKYTSEDNESFNTVLDKQNNSRRKKHGHLWTPDQRIPSQRLIAYRTQQTKLLEAQSNHEALATKHNEKALVPISVGATASRPALVQSWQQKTPNNNLMFHPQGSVDELGLQSVMEAKEAASKAGPKETVFANTRFPPLYSRNESEPGSVPSSPSLNTTIIARRDARRAAKAHSDAPTEISFGEGGGGGDTPRVNGYAFVDEDEPENVTASPTENDGPTYRDLLAGQTGDSTPNPFKLSEIRRREDLHLRLVAKDQARKRDEVVQRATMTSRTPIFGMTASSHHHHRAGAGTTGGGNMTPAARRLMDKLGQTPLRRTTTGITGGLQQQQNTNTVVETNSHKMYTFNKKNPGGKEEEDVKEMWTPTATPRRRNKEMK